MPFSADPFVDAIGKLDFPAILARVARSCSTPLGEEHILALHPSPIFAEVRDELARAREMMTLLARDEIPDLEGVRDVRESLHRAAIEGSVLGGDALHHIRLFLRACRTTSQFFSKRDTVAPLLSMMGELIYFDKTLEYHIERVVEEDGRVKDSASRELREIRRAIIDKSGSLRRRLESILKRIAAEEVAQEELITLRDGRMVLPVKTEYKNAVPGFIHSSSASGQTVYIEPAETLELNNEIRELEFEEQREVHRLLAELTDRVRGARGELLRTAGLIAEMDSLVARARYARDFHADCPEVLLDGAIDVVHGRHPLLLLHKRAAEVVPLSVTVGEGPNTVIITGPNAGGKSVAMKTVGLLALMAQSGIPVPADASSRFPVYANIAVDIGDEQSVENDLSTFSSHVGRLASIVARAGERTLVLIDEIGTGTDPAEGSALGAAILERLTEAGAHVIATTHHGMLKAFADQHPRMQNAAMEFDLTTLEPTYRFRSGLPGSSYAFEITRRIGMPERILDRARDLLGTQAQSLEHLLSEVEKRSQLLARQMRALEEQKEKLDRLVADYQQKTGAWKQEARELRRAALDEARQIVAGANTAIEKAVREIRETQGAKETVRQARTEVAALKQEIEKERAELPRSAEPAAEAPIRINDRVALKDNPSMSGIVIEDLKEGSFLVAFGSIKLKTRAESLVRGTGGAVEAPRAAAPLYQPRIESNEIDIRGLYGDEAVKVLDTFLFEAQAAGLKRVDVIHGKGTGALRKRVHDYLREVSFVERFQLADWNEGGSGMTVVILK